MSTSESSRSRWSLLAIPPTTTEEIAIAPCDGCDKNPLMGRIVQAVAQRQAPHLACIHPIPPLIFHKGPGTQHRYEAAQARISVAGCQENCPKTLLSSVASLEREVILSPDAPFESQVRTLEDAVVSYSALIPQSPQTPAFLLPAAQAPQRRRFAKLPASSEPSALSIATTASISASSKVSAAPSLAAMPVVAVPTTQSTHTSASSASFSTTQTPSAAVARFSETPRTGLFQDQAKQASRNTLYLGILVFVLLAAGAWWRLSRPSSPTSAMQENSPLSRRSPETKQPSTPQPNTPLSLAGGPSVARNAPMGATKAAKSPNSVAPDTTRKSDATKPTTQKPDTTASDTTASDTTASDTTASDATKPDTTTSADRRAVPRRPAAKRSEEPQRPAMDAAHLLRSKMVNQGWIGGLCSSQQSCGYANPMCLPVPKGGYCTRYCLSWCPRSTNPWHASSSCIRADALAAYFDPLPSTKGGLCVTHCDFKLFPKHGCRVGTQCLELRVNRGKQQTRRVCVPTPPAASKESP